MNKKNFLLVLMCTIFIGFSINTVSAEKDSLEDNVEKEENARNDEDVDEESPNQKQLVEDEEVSIMSNPIALKKPMRHAEVVKLKKDLSKIGFHVPGNGTNYFGLNTETRVKEFQSYYGLEVDGSAGPRTLEKITAILSSPLQNGNRHQDTVQLKKDLAELGFQVPGTGTNYFGPQTEGEVKEFQRVHGLTVNGIADEVTLAKLQELLSPDLKKGMRHPAVVQLKQDLSKLGFPVPGNGTTYFGSKTEEKVKLFQEYYGVNPTGIADEETLNLLEEIVSTPLQKGKRHQDTVKLKEDLAFLVLEVPGNGTTYYGTKTRKKVREFQGKNKLVVNGIADPVTLEKINSLVTAPMSKGVYRQDVVKLKSDLKKLGFPVPGNGTPLYGPKTEEKVKKFQNYYGLTDDGIAGPNTLGKIDEILSSPLQRGKRHQDTVQLKRNLAELGFQVPGNGTTLYGLKTEEKVKEFQTEHGLIVNGIADEVTLAKIQDLLNPVLKKGTRHPAVVQLKRDLAELGFRVPGNGTNYFGPETERKVKQFQSEYGLKVNGIADEVTLAKIQEALSDRGSTDYDLTIGQALNMQMKVAPQTDSKYAWVSKDYIKNGKVTATTLNIRKGPGTSGNPLGTLSKGTKVNILDEYNGWYAIDYEHKTQWVHAHSSDVRYYLDPTNFLNDKKQKFQFLDLSKPSDASVTALNNYLKGKGILEGEGQSFIDAGREHGINDVYLISHATLETGNGTSELATGIEVGVKENGEYELVTNKNRKNLKNIKTVYNMFGIGAVDRDPIRLGAIRAYQEGWTTPAKAIVGGARFIGNDYIQKGQNTLYKMRWNPEHMDRNGSASHQYATDIGWASKQITTMYNLYQQLDDYILYLDIPKYK